MLSLPVEKTKDFVGVLPALAFWGMMWKRLRRRPVVLEQSRKVGHEAFATTGMKPEDTRWREINLTEKEDLTHPCDSHTHKKVGPWLVWLSGLSTGL